MRNNQKFEMKMVNKDLEICKKTKKTLEEEITILENNNLSNNTIIKENREIKQQLILLTKESQECQD